MCTVFDILTHFMVWHFWCTYAVFVVWRSRHFHMIMTMMVMMTMMIKKIRTQNMCNIHLQ